MGGGLQKDNGKCQQIRSSLNLIDGLALEAKEWKGQWKMS